MMKTGIFVTATDTDVGKTWVSAALLAAAPSHVRYWKPVQTGPDSDTAKVLELTGLSAARVHDRGVRLPLPASPHFAARQAGVQISLDAVLAEAPDGPCIVEGAGGLLVPLHDHALMTDLIAALHLPTLLVARTRLGTINHTLLSLRELQRCRLPCLGVVLVGPADPSVTTALAAHADVPVLAEVPWYDQTDPTILRAIGQQLLSFQALDKALGTDFLPSACR